MTKVTNCSTPIGECSSFCVSLIHLLLPFLSYHPRHYHRNIFRARWRALRTRRLAAEEAADAESRAYEEREAENLRRESEQFLARQMDEMHALQDEQRKAGLLLDDGAPVKLNVSLTAVAAASKDTGAKEKAMVFGQDEDEEEGLRKRKAPPPRLDLAEGGEKAKEKLEKIKGSVSQDKEVLFKAKVRWDGLSDVSVWLRPRLEASFFFCYESRYIYICVCVRACADCSE